MAPASPSDGVLRDGAAAHDGAGDARVLHGGAPLDDVLRRHFRVDGGVLHVGGVAVSELAARFGTPLYAYDAAILTRQLDALRGALPPQFRLAYSVKANPGAAILRHFVDRGLGLEVASAGELLRALAAGCAPERIMFAGPGKTTAELELAVTHGIGEVHVESVAEARRLAAVCTAAGRTMRVALRVNPAAAVEGGSMRMGARAVPFGIDEAQLDGALDAVFAEPTLRLVGVHLFVGTQILQHDVLLAQYREGLRIAAHVAAHVAARSGRRLDTVDLGGGLGVPYLPSEKPLDLAALRAGLVDLMHIARAHPGLADATFMLEPGRFLVAEAGVYVSRVTEVKQSRDRTFVIIDGGMHHHLAASGNLGQAIRRNFPIAAIERLDEGPDMVADLVGPLCTPLDTTGRQLELPRVREGDLIGIFQSGAYALTASPTAFLSRPMPAEVLVQDGSMTVIRAAGAAGDYVQDGG